MGIRENLNESPATAIKAFTILIVIAIGVSVWYLWPAKKPTVSNLEFYSDDDGQHWFTDDAKKIAPFDHNGKEAVVAHVYACGSTQFVGYLQKYSDGAKKRLAAPSENPSHSRGVAKVQPVFDTGILIKKPKGTAWIPFDGSEAARDVMTIKCPNGGDDFLPVLPQ